MIQKCGLWRPQRKIYLGDLNGIIARYRIQVRADGAGSSHVFFSLSMHVEVGVGSVDSIYIGARKYFLQVLENGILERISREQRQLQEAMFEVRQELIFFNCFYLFLFYHLHPFIIYNSLMHIFSLWSALFIYTRR